MIEPQIKWHKLRDPDTRETRFVWQLYYFTGAMWSVPMTWTCDTRAEARWIAFAHQWARIGGSAAGVPEREIGRCIAEGLRLQEPLAG